ncbi:TIGR01777 family protein [Ferrimonas sediminicola]|uniref:TIGR01777 family protein n=1 Tax=Ferrimonas sediminicola TaxID=2569538 RepID=A0A4U1B9W5_9GAMM|nr:TIGR01777 family oxidoreductase [Ferrimonas sediminicola]TKB47284.1 TIGR01777 family protein [Ferrimonas sediminicola]
MKILVTGGTGFVGRRLLKQLGSAHQLVVISRHPERASQQLQQQGIEAECIGIAALPWLQGVDAVINLAGEPIADRRWSGKQKHLICDSRWRLTQTLSDWILAQEFPPKVFISASAIGIYGTDSDEIQDEDTPLVYNEQDFAQKVCHTWESLAMQASPHTRVCVLRIGLVLGEGGALRKMLPAFRAGVGGPIGDGSQTMSWIHIDDLVAVIGYLMMTDDCQGVFNGTTPAPVSNKEFSRTLGRTLRRPAFMAVPAAVLKLALGEMSSLLLKGQRVLPNRLVRHGFSFRYPELPAALEAVLGR